MKYLKENQTKYFEQVKELVQKKSFFTKAIFNYFGMENKEYIEERFKKLVFCIYHPGKELLECSLNELNFELSMIRDNISTAIFQFLQCRIVNGKYLLTPISFANRKFYDQIMSEIFLKDDFDLEDIKKLPFFHFSELSPDAQKSLLLSFYEGRISLEEAYQNFQTFPLLLEHYSADLKKYFDEYHFKLGNKRLIRDELQDHSDFCFLNSFGYKSLKEEKRISMKLQEESHKYSTGFHTKINNQGYVGVMVYGALETWIHELCHEIFDSKLCDMNLGIIFELFGLPKAQLSVNGIFYDSDREAMEVFTDFMTSEIFHEYKIGQLVDWNYELQASSSYKKFFPLVYVFMNYFGFLTRYAMIHHQPNLIRQVVGVGNFQEYVSLFSKTDDLASSLPDLILRAKEIVAKMVEYAKGYQPNYYEQTSNYIADLQSKGVKVRVLKPSMDHLKEQEKMIQSTINDL